MPPADAPTLSVIIPACNEEAYLGQCLAAIMAQDPISGPIEIVVAANACTDGTVPLARRFVRKAEARGWQMQVLDLARGGKVGALNAADCAARSGIRVYLDADVLCEPAILGQIRTELDRPVPLYATGTLAVAPAKSIVTRAYARIWTRLPFVQSGAVGAGLFAVNASGRARWADWPAIISDDTFVRLNFAPSERIQVPARYHWPMVEGFQNLIRVRRRQDAGVQEVYRLYPHLRVNEAKHMVGQTTLARLGLTDPAGFLIYVLVHAAVRLRPPSQDWIRGR